MVPRRARVHRLAAKLEVRPIRVAGDEFVLLWRIHLSEKTLPARISATLAQDAAHSTILDVHRKVVALVLFGGVERARVACFARGAEQHAHRAIVDLLRRASLLHRLAQLWPAIVQVSDGRLDGVVER